MDFFLKNLEETLEAINKCINKQVYCVNTKRIRRCNNVKSNDRSKINFYWRSLSVIEKYTSILEPLPNKGSKMYKIIENKPINIQHFSKNIIDKIDNNGKLK